MHADQSKAIVIVISFVITDTNISTIFNKYDFSYEFQKTNAENLLT